MSVNLQAALQYAKQGLAVFPCVGKMPAIPVSEGGKGLYDATTSAERITEWWTAHPEWNIGIPCGKASNLIVLDVDPDKGGNESLEKMWMTLGPFQPVVPVVITGTGGRHYYFLYEEGIRNKVGFLPGLDIRSQGGYVIAPPSIHPVTLKPYTFQDVPNSSMIKMPDYLSEMLRDKESGAVKPDMEDGEQVPKGGRNDFLARMAGSMQRRGISLDAIFAALMAENQSKCNPPLPEYEVKRIVESIGRYAPEVPADKLYQVQESRAPEGLTESDSGDGLIHIGALSEKAMSYLKDKAKVKGTPTGLDGLDKLLGGGRRLGEVTCWHAEAKTGKNTLWHYLMYIWLELGIPMAYASRELSPEEEVIPNLLSIATGSNAWLGDVTVESQAQYDATLIKWPLYFSEGYGYFAPSDIKSWVQKGIKAGIKHFWFDHLHYMLEDPEDHKAASKLIKDLKALAKIEKISIDIIIQPNKLQDGQKLSLNSIKGGAAMGQAIDNLLILERMRGEGIKNVSKLTLEVARSKLCKPGSIYLQFDSDSTRFVETEPDEVAPQKTENTQLIDDSIPVADRGQNSRLTHQPFKKLI